MYNYILDLSKKPYGYMAALFKIIFHSINV